MAKSSWSDSSIFRNNNWLSAFRANPGNPTDNRHGAHRDDAIVLDDDDDTQQVELIDLSVDEETVKAEPSIDASPYVEVSKPRAKSPQAARKTDINLDDELFVYDNEPERVVQADERFVNDDEWNEIHDSTKDLASLAKRLDGSQHPVPPLELARSSDKEPYISQGALSSRRNGVTTHNQGTPTARMYPPLEKAESISQITSASRRDGPSRRSKTPVVESGQEHTQSSPKQAQPLENHTAPTVEPSSEPTQTPVSPAERLGFAALPSAKDDSRYAHLYSNMGIRTASQTPKQTKSSSGIAPRARSIVKNSLTDSKQKISQAPSAALRSHPILDPTSNSTARKQRRQPPKDSVPQTQALDVLKSNRKRPLSEMSVGQLFRPDQIISQSAWETSKRQRHEKKLNRTSQDSIEPVHKQNEPDTGTQDNPAIPAPEPFEVGDQAIIGSDHIPTGPDLGSAELPESTKTNHISVRQEPESGVEDPDSGRAVEIERLIRPARHDQPPPRPEIEPKDGSSLAKKHSNIAVDSKETAIQSQHSTLIPEKSSDPQQPTLDIVIPPEDSPATEAITQAEKATPPARATIGGKGISAATLAVWQAGGDRSAESGPKAESLAPDVDDIVLKPVYHYYVARSEGRVNGLESDAIETKLGPYHTVEEANAVASKEIRHPIAQGNLAGQPGKGWSFYFEQDEYGMQNHAADVLGTRIDATVTRELAPPETRLRYPSKAFKITPRVYLIQELAWSPTPLPAPENPDPTTTEAPTPVCDTITHACVTNIEHANRRAAEQWLQCYTGAWSDFGAEGRQKTEVERALKRDLVELAHGRETFEREVEFETGGVVKFWVEEVVVQGARN